MDKFTKNIENMTTTTQDHYSLRWNNHQNHILRAFDTLLQTKALVDVTLVCAEISIQAHKIVLSACSPFFQRVFAETPCKHPVIVLKDFRGWVVQAIVDFMYRGEISVPQERLQTLIQAGESLQVRGLVENNVPENNPTPAASPDDFGMLDTSLLSSEYGRCSSSFDEECPTMVNNNGAKIMLSQHMFSAAAMAVAASASASTSITSTDNNREPSTQLSGSRSELCTSPMPRRKQARPRRRSGECPPPDLNSSSKPNTPTPQNKPTNGEHLEEDNDYEEEEEEEEENDEIQDVEDHVEAIKIEVDKNRDRDLINNTETEKRTSNNINSSSENNENENIMNTNETETNNDDKNEDETGLNLNKRQNNSISEGPENLCTKKQKVNDGINNQNNEDDDEVKCTDPNDKEDKEQKQKEDSANNNTPINNNRIVLSLKDIRHLNKQPTISCRSPNPFQPPPHELIRPPSLHRDPHLRDHSRDNMKNDSLDISRGPMDSMPDHDSPLHFDHMDLSMAAAAAAAAHHHNQMNVNSLLGPGGPHHHPPPPPPPHHHHHHRGQLERLEESLANRLNKEFTPSSPMSLPPHFNPSDGPPHPPSPLPFPGMSSALALTPPHMFGLDSPLGLFPPGMDPGKLYNPLMDMTDPRGLPGDHPPFMKKKMPRPKGQHSAPRGGPPRSWTNAELTEALQHVWNKKMTTSQASRIFGIPYNSLLMYVRGKYGKSLKLEQLRKDCISGPPIELLQMGINSGGNGNNSGSGGNNTSGNNSSKNNKNHNLNDSRAKELSELENSIQRSLQNEADLLQGNPLFNPFPPGFYPDFPGGFPGLPLSMLNLLPPERHPPSSASSSSSAAAAAAAAAAALHLNMDEDCKSDRSKQSLEDDFPQPLALNRDIDRRELLMQPNGQD